MGASSLRPEGKKGASPASSTPRSVPSGSPPNSQLLLQVPARWPFASSSVSSQVAGWGQGGFLSFFGGAGEPRVVLDPAQRTVPSLTSRVLRKPGEGVAPVPVLSFCTSPTYLRAKGPFDFARGFFCFLASLSVGSPEDWRIFSINAHLMGTLRLT